MTLVRSFVLLMVSVVLVGSAFAVSAAPAEATVTITEPQINASFRVTNPISRRVTNLHVDLQPGQAVISATITLGRPTGSANATYQVVSTWTPAVSNGRLSWTLVSATANGAPASTSLISQINTAIGVSWRSWWRSQNPGRVTGITITDTQATITFG